MNIIRPKKRKTGLAVALTLVVTACSSLPDGGNSSLFGSYDQATLLNNAGNSLLLAGINTFSTSATAAITAINSFTDDPTASTLTDAQTAWTTLAEDWAAAAPFNIGPMNDDLISANVDTWPVSSTKIESAISSQLNAANVGADTKGLKGLEYLLFDAAGNPAVLTKYTAADAANRKAFLKSVAQNLATQASSLQSYWTSGYLASFTTAKGNDVSSTVSQLVNTIAFYLDNIKNAKVGNPIGMGVKINDNQSHPDKIEYTLAEESLPVMKANVQAMKTVFDGGSAQGLDDLLNYLKATKNGQNLSAVIDSQFDEVVNNINALSPPYATAVGSNKQQVQDVFNSLKLLISYFKVDVANNLGVTITFSDTDGD